MRYIYTVLIYLCMIASVTASDPVVLVSASDSTVVCGTADIEVMMADWYIAAGGAVVEDPDGGDITFVADLTLVEALTAFQQSLGQGCGTNQTVTVSFTALDDDGDSAGLGTVTFSTIDDQNPVFTTLPSFISYTCQEGIQDTLNEWVRTRGGAQAMDNCSDIIWTDFIWNDSGGNSGVGDIATGPYPEIIASCDYFINMSFLVLDDCGNQRAATGRFSLVDDTPPILPPLPKGIIVSCDNIPEPDDVVITDFCDPTATYIVVDESTQSGDEGDCGFHNYQLRRFYTASDACGNTSVDSAIYIVRDLAAPVINGQDTVTVSCVEFEDGAALFISAVDDCGEVTIDTEDTEYTPACSTTVDRLYTVTDPCGNEDVFAQHIIIRDRTGPQFAILPADRIVGCTEGIDVEADFASWVQATVAEEVIDACTEGSVFAAVPGSYSTDDISTWPGEAVGSLDEGSCPSLAGFSRVETVDFVAVDQCGNATVVTAQYGVQDDTAPVITNCVSDISVSVPADECVANVPIEALIVMDDCSGIDIASVDLGGLSYEVDLTNGTVLQSIAAGSYEAELIVQDCAGNVSRCPFSVKVLDEQAPMITACPTDEEIALTGNMCDVVYELSTEISAKDNCGFTDTYNVKLPASTANELLTYSVSGADTILNNETFTFSNVEPINFSENDIVLDFAITSPETTGAELFTLFGEEGVTLGSIAAGPACGVNTQQVIVPRQEFNSWVQDGEFTISLISTAEVSPCSAILANGSDGVARLSVRLSYSEARVMYSISGSTEVAAIPLADAGTVVLSAGTNEVTYVVADASGNVDSCQYTVIVTDDVAPQAVCKNAVINIPPDGEQTVTLDPALVDDGSSDLCSDVELQVVPATFDCSQLGTELEVMLIVTDISGNSDSCSSFVKVEPLDLNPSFSAGICQDDSLLLFANAPLPTTPGSYTYDWTGPGFTSTDENPFILNASEANSGLYSVTVTGFGGCSAVGTVQVNVAPLTTPDITALSDTICAGDELALTATTFTGSVTYDWYEQGANQDILLGSTTAATFIITPTSGDHFYYVVGNSENCTSNPSASVAVSVIDIPIAEVTDNFINICEEGSFTLGTTTFGAGFTYEWTGPNGFESDKAFPEEFTDVTPSAAGEYNLVVTVANCVSDTAVTRVNIFDKPIIPVITAGETFCEGSTVSLTVNNIANADLYTWYLNGQLYTSDMDNSLVITNAQANISGSWQVTVRDGICDSDTSDVANIIIEDLQDISVTNSGPSCEGDSLQLFVTFVAGATYQWTGPGGFSSTVQNPRIAAVAGEYAVEIVTGTNCETSASTTVTVSSAPVVTALSNNSQECMDGETNIVFFPTIVPAGGNYTYQWTGPGGFTSDELNPILVNPTEIVNGTYILQVSSGQCSSEPVESVVDITIIPAQPTISISANNCVGQDVSLTADITGTDLTYQWSTPTGTEVTTDPTLVIEAASINDQGEYVVVVVDGACTSVASEPAELSVIAQPNPPAFTTNSPVCFGSDIVLTVIGGNDMDTYEWIGPDGTVVGQGKELILPAADPTLAGDYQVSVQVGECLSPLSSPQVVEVLAELAVPIPEQAQYDICAGVTTSLQICVSTSTAEPGATYVLAEAGSGEILAESTSVCFDLTDLSAFDSGTNLVTLLTTSESCLSIFSSSFIVEVSSAPSIDANILTADQSLCDSDEITLMAQQGLPVVDVQWYTITGEADITSPNAQSTTATILTSGITTIGLAYSAGACINFDTDTISLVLPEEILVSDDSYQLDDRDPIELDVLDNDDLPEAVTLTLTELPLIGTAEVQGSSILYTPDQQLSGTIAMQYEVCSVICPDVCEEGTVTVTVGNVDDCLAPTIITPNDDNINDRFEVPCLSSGIYSDSKLIVFNQWGDEVFSADNYDNSWAGTYEGKTLAAGTYFFILDLGDGSEPLHSFLIIQK